jgi:hypothetical protein
MSDLVVQVAKRLHDELSTCGGDKRHFVPLGLIASKA